MYLSNLSNVFDKIVKLHSTPYHTTPLHSTSLFCRKISVAIYAFWGTWILNHSNIIDFLLCMTNTLHIMSDVCHWTPIILQLQLQFWTTRTVKQWYYQKNDNKSDIFVWNRRCDYNLQFHLLHLRGLYSLLYPYNHMIL